MATHLMNILKSNNCWSVLSQKEIRTFINSNVGDIEALIELAISDNKEYSFRIVWLLFKGTEKNDPRIKPFLSDLISGIENKKSGHQRELIRLIMKHELSDVQESALYDQCIVIWKDLSLKPGTRYYAFLFLHQLLLKYPELMNELRSFLTENYLETLSPGIKHSIKKKTTKLRLN
jgi:hypothetical protein